MFSFHWKRSFLLLLILHLFHNLAFAQAPLAHEPGTPISDEDLNATYTHLVGFEDCSRLEQQVIIQAFWDAAFILNSPNVRNSQTGDKGIDWNKPAAIEYLGSPFSRPYWNTIQGESPATLCISVSFC